MSPLCRVACGCDDGTCYISDVQIERVTQASIEDHTSCFDGGPRVDRRAHPSMNASRVGRGKTREVASADGHGNCGIDNGDVGVVQITISTIVLTTGEISDRSIWFTCESRIEPGVFLKESLLSIT